MSGRSKFMAESEANFDTVEHCIESANLREKQGFKTQVLEYLQMAVSLYLNDHDEDEFVADLYKRIGENLRDLDCFYNAYGYLMMAHDIYRRKFGEGSKQVAKSNCGIGEFFLKKQEYYNAITYYQDGVNKLIRIYGDNDKELAPYYVVLAKTYNLGSTVKQLFEEKNTYLEKVIHWYEKALSLYRKYYDSNDLTIAAILIDIGDIYKKIEKQNGDNEWDKAILYWNEAIEIYIANYKVDSVEVANLFYIIGCAIRNFRLLNNRANGKFESVSNRYLEKALEIFTKLGMGNSEVVAKINFKMGRNYLRDNDPRAVACYSNRIDIIKKVYGEDNERLDDCYVDYLNALDTLGMVKEYKAVEEEYDAMYKRQHPFTIEEGQITPEQCLYCARLNVSKEQLDFANDYYKKAASLYDKQGDRKSQAEVYCEIAQNHIDLKYHLQNAAEYLKKACDIYDEIKVLSSEEKANLYFRLAHEYNRTTQYHEALEYEKKAKDIYLQDQSKYIYQIANCNMLQGLAYENLEMHDLATRFFKEAISKAEELNRFDKLIPECYIEIANCYASMGMYKDAIHYCIKAKDIYEKVIDQYELKYVQCYLMLGKFCKQLQLYEKAIDYLLEGIYEISYENISESITREMCQEIADNYMFLGDTNLVAKWREKALLVGRYIYPTQYGGLASLLSSIGQYKKAAFYCERALERAKTFNEEDGIQQEYYPKMIDLLKKSGLKYAADWAIKDYV